MPALATASFSTPMRRRVGLWSHMRAPLSLALSACTNRKNTTIYMKNITLIALIGGVAVLAGASALTLPVIRRAPRPRPSAAEFSAKKPQDLKQQKL